MPTIRRIWSYHVVVLQRTATNGNERLPQKHSIFCMSLLERSTSHTSLYQQPPYCCFQPISSPEAAILLVCARNRDLWATLKARRKYGQISLAVVTCSFQPQSLTHAQNQTGTRNSWFRFLNRPEPLRFLTAGPTQALGTRLCFQLPVSFLCACQVA